MSVEGEGLQCAFFLLGDSMQVCMRAVRQLAFPGPSNGQLGLALQIMRFDIDRLNSIYPRV